MSVTGFEDLLYWAKTATLAAGLLAGGVQHACDSTPTPPPGNTPAIPTTTPVNPCDEATSATGGTGSATVGLDKYQGLIDFDVQWGVLDSVWNHRTALARNLLDPIASDAVTEDVGDIAVLQDEGDLFQAVNPYDLRDVNLRFTPNPGGGYDVTRTGVAAFRSPLGDAVALGDDDTTPLALGFAFPFYGGSHQNLFVNSDGNLTFEEGDDASSPRSVSRLLSGPPRIAPFLSDLDPSAGGAVFASTGSDATTVTWCDVPGFGESATTTVQASLLADGVVEMTFDEGIAIADVVVGLSPGRTSAFASADLSATEPASSGAGAIGERFSLNQDLDTVAVARKFFQTHPDQYDQLLIFGDRSLVFDGAFAFETTVANDIQGIGQPLFSIAPDFGSQQLSSIAVMGRLGKYSDDPTEKVLGENTTSAILGHEVGHRWLSFLQFSDHDRNQSTALLGRAQAHWSFFFDSDASVMEGNDIVDLGGGMFETVGATNTYGALDRYAMGLIPDTEVPPFFYVEAPSNIAPFVSVTSPPQIGVTFNGTRRDVLIQDVVEVSGPRVPSSDSAPRVQRQAFIYIVSPDLEADPAQIAKLDRIRNNWESFFSVATGGLMRAETRLLP